MTTRKKATPKPVRLWALVNRDGGKPYIVWSVLAHTRRDMEHSYLYWMCGMSDAASTERERLRFRDAIKSGRCTIERVTVAPEVRRG